MTANPPRRHSHRAPIKPTSTAGQQPTSPWRGRGFRWYFVGTVTSWLGSSMAPIALAFAVLSTFHSNSALGLVLAARSIPLLVFLVLGGALADRLPRARLLTLANLGSALTQAAVAGLLLCGAAHLGAIIVLEAVNGAITAFTQPASSGIVAELVAPAGRQRANSTLSAAASITTIAGRPLAGVIVAAAGGGWAIALDAASYLVAAFATSRLSLPRSDPAAHRHSLLGDIRGGWHAFRSTTWIWVGSLTVSLVNCIQAGIWTVLGPQTAEHTMGPAAWGLVLSAGAAGTLTMSSIMYRLTPRYLLRFGHLCLPLGALPLLTLALTPGPALLAAASFIGGTGTAALNIAWTTSLHNHIPTRLLSRVTAFDNLGAFIAIPLGQTLITPLATLTGTTPTETLGSLLFATFALLPLTIPAVRQLPTTPPRPE